MKRKARTNHLSRTSMSNASTRAMRANIQAMCTASVKSLKRIMSVLLVLAMLVTTAPQSLLSDTVISAEADTAAASAQTAKTADTAAASAQTAKTADTAAASAQTAQTADTAAALAEETSMTLQNPRIVEDSSMDAGQKVTWDCVWFGSYPQTEIVDKAEKSGCYGKDWKTLSDYEVNASLYEKLKSAAYYDTSGNTTDSSGDTTIDGTKYRRIKKSDAAYSTSGDGYYNWSNDTSYHYFRYDPIKWRVLNVSDSKALLLADKALDDQKYNTEYTSVTWETSTIRSWLNGYGSASNAYGTDYSSKNFIDSAFTSNEQSAIDTTLVENKDNPLYSTEGGNDTNDKIFLLSESEIYKDNAFSYGFLRDYDKNDEARGCLSSTFAKAMGTWSGTDSYYIGNCWWWLRSPGFDTDYAAYVNVSGNVYDVGKNVNYNTHACRPALNLNLLSSDQFSYAGTVKSDGTVSNDGTVSELTALKNPRILKDSSMDAGQKVTWNCIWFGSYPQTEIVDKAETSGCCGKSWASDSDYEVDASLYEKLKSATYYDTSGNTTDSSGDTTIDGTKYRRIKKTDSTFSMNDFEIYYNWSDDSTYHYFRYDPIKWRVLNVSDGKALLLADKVLDDQKYNTSYTSVTWETSTIRSWLNGYDSTSNAYKTDYSIKNFIDSAFTSDEQSAIETTLVVNSDNLSYSKEGGNDTNDKIFLLSESEVYTDNAKSYGFISSSSTYDEARRCKSSAFAKAMGTRTNKDSDYLGNCWWWMRSPGANTNFAAIAGENGCVSCIGDNVDHNSHGCRPALNVNLLSSDKISYAGTVSSGGIISKNPVDDTCEHSLGTPEYTWSDDGKKCTAEVSCTRENCSYKVTEAGVITSKVTTAATRSEMGTTTYTAKFKNNLFPDQTKQIQDIPKIGDGSSSGGSTSGGSTSGGSTSGGSTSGGNTDDKSKEETAAAYSITIPDNIANGTVAASAQNAKEGDIVVLTVTADEKYKLGSLTVKTAEGKSVDATAIKEGSKYSFVMPASDVVVEATFEETEKDPANSSNPFADVPSSAYFYDAVQWAYNKKIATGTDATHFSPNGITNRAQAVTFLWRTAGEKASSYDVPFVDVSAGAYYYEAVRWACSENITKGMTDETFGPLSEVSRAQMVTFLWRMAGSPKADSKAAGGSDSENSANAVGGKNLSFSDVSSDSYYYDAVNWAVSRGITAGMSATTFAPDSKCTRAQVVTFIYRYKNEK